MKQSGIFISSEELSRLKTAHRTSGMFLSGGEPIGNPGGIVASAIRKYGLPDDSSVDGNTGEFYVPEWWKPPAVAPALGALGATPGPWWYEGTIVTDGLGYVATPGSPLGIAEEERANGRLISAAPDLYAIGAEILHWATEVDGAFDVFAEDLVPKLHRALAKARGEAAA